MIIRDITRGGLVRHPEKTAVVSGNTRLTYRLLHERINRLSNALQEMGLRKGDIVAVMADNCPQYPEIVGMSIKMGIPIAPFMVSVEPSDLVSMINNCQAKAIIYSERFQPTIDEMRDMLGHIRYDICLGDERRPARSYEDLLADHSPDEPLPPTLSYQDLSYVGSTSGTTGVPKQTMRTYETTLAVAMEIAYALDLTSSDVYLQPCTAIFGIGCWRLLFHLGCTCVLPNDFTPQNVLSCIERERATKIFTTARCIRELLNYPGIHGYNLPSLRRIWVTGAPLGAQEWKLAVERFGSIFVQAYSIQEQAPISLLYPEDFEDALKGSFPQRLQSVGRSSPGTRVRIVDGFGNELPHGELGEIVTSGPNLVQGYLNNPDETRKAIRDGEFFTGDLGLCDEDGYFYLKGRKSDVIYVDGKLVLPQDVENVLLSHNEVLDVAVAGISDTAGRSSLFAFVIAKGEVSGKDLISFCTEKLPPHAVPAKVVFVDDFPKTASGKVIKYKLLDQYGSLVAPSQT